MEGIPENWGHTRAASERAGERLRGAEQPPTEALAAAELVVQFMDVIGVGAFAF